MVARASGGIPTGTPRSGSEPTSASFSAALISSQPGLDLARRRRRSVGEDVRVAADQLGHDDGGDVVDVERRLGVLLGDPGMERDLEQDVAELLDYVVAVARLERSAASCASSTR